MHFKTLSILSLLVIFMSCKKTQDSNVEINVENTNSKEVTEKDISKIDYVEFDLDLKAEDIVKNWLGYSDLQENISNIKKGDLTFFKDNEESINALLKELKSGIPKEIKVPSISARVTVLETKLHKLKSLSNLSTTSKEELIDTIKDFLISFSSLNLQVNKKVEFDSRKIEKPQ
ncbi:hypothetical protein [Flavivirga eckloniae]|uniref:Lipoprotein n=1 Tax=Flavivirga eckloniae TaxID=1803846 RepID=A0A2K9PPS8_9FLAO|nr:hypothetical protein [Flavivirga eckloniae]AUP79046.1 hypothetical protein C1H87_10185 [Flavivirga eckloniae]